MDDIILIVILLSVIILSYVLKKASDKTRKKMLEEMNEHLKDEEHWFSPDWEEDNK